MFLAVIVMFTSCRNNGKKVGGAEENRQAKAMLQGIWVDEETESVMFRAKGDTIYYPDTISVPAYFRIINDTLVMKGSETMYYPIVKQAQHIFWVKNQNGDLLKLVRSDNAGDINLFIHKQPHVLSVTHVVKRDTVINYDGERYHIYVALNPTKYKVLKHTYNDDGVEVDNVYYDNIIHLSLFHGAEQLFSSDFNKQMFAKKIPGQFLDQAILGDIVYSHADASGFHFNATICIPDGASCYMVEVVISTKGKLRMQLLEY